MSTDPATILAERGSVVSRALLDMGANGHRASEAATWYVNTLSAIYTEARNFGFARDRNVVSIGELQAKDLRTVVTRNGKDRFGDVWLSSSKPLILEADWVDGHNRAMHARYEV